MWSYLKSLAMRTMLTLACLTFLSANRFETVAPSAGLAGTSGPDTSSSKAAGGIEMQVVSGPPLESRLPRGNLAVTQTAAVTSVQTNPAISAADTAEMVLFQAIIAEPESDEPETDGPARSSGGPGGDSSRGRVDPDLPPKFDPNYDSWQKDADIKLNEEKARAQGKDHPIAAANPDSYLVICLGGCRPSSDKIVYRVSRMAAAAAAIAQRRMETTAAEAASGSGKKPEASEQNDVACIAGCYANQEISPQIKSRRAAAAPKVRPVRVAARNPAVKMPAVKMPATPALASAHRISAETQGHFAKKRVTGVIRETQTWRTKIVFATKKAARLAAKRDRTQRAAVTKISRSRSAKRNPVITEASGFIF